MDLSVSKSFVVRFPDSNKSKTIIKISLSVCRSLNRRTLQQLRLLSLKLRKLFRRENIQQSIKTEESDRPDQLSLMFYNLETEAGLGAMLEESPVCY